MAELLAGVDEAGRGPLAGPVVASAVILGTGHGIQSLADSKMLSPIRRERIYAQIKRHALAVGLGFASAAEIDQLNILQATMLAMARAVEDLPRHPSRVLVDGDRCPAVDYPVEAVVGGDATVECISAASIVAKVVRDDFMRKLHERYPQYGFDQHKGYPTKLHRDALEVHGPSPEHRVSFAPVARAKIAGAR